MANTPIDNKIEKLTTEIMANIRKTYPGAIIPSNFKDIIESYVDGQTKSKHGLIIPSEVPASKPSPNADPDALGILYDAQHNRITYIKDRNGNDVAIDLQIELFKALRNRLISSIDRAEKTIVGTEMCYDVEDKSGSVSKKNKPLDFSDRYSCAHLLGLPLRVPGEPDKFKQFFDDFKTSCINQGISVDVSFPTKSTVSVEFEEIKNKVADFFNDKVTKVTNLKEFSKTATELTIELRNFYDRNKAKLTEAEASELADIFTLVSNNFKNMERLYYNDMEVILEYFRTPEFAFTANEVLNSSNIYILVGGTPKKVDMDEYIMDEQKFFEDLPFFCYEDRKLVFPALNKTKLHPNIVEKLVNDDPLQMVVDAKKIANDLYLEEKIMDYLSETDEDKKKEYLNVIRDICEQLKYAPRIIEEKDGNTFDLIESLKIIDTGNDKIVEFYVNNLINYIENRDKQQYDSRSYNQDDFYLKNRFRTELLQAVLKEYHGDIKNLSIHRFYEEHIEMFPYYIPSSKIEKIKTFDEMMESFPFRQECEQLFNTTDVNIINLNTQNTLDKLFRYFSSKELTIDDYVFYNELQERISTNLKNHLGDQSQIFDNDFAFIEDLFHNGYSLTTAANMLDTRRLEIETGLSLSAIQQGKDYDPLLVFKYMLEHNDGTALEQFLSTNGGATMNFAKIASKERAFFMITGISNANMEFNIGEDKTKTNTTYITRNTAYLELFTNSYKIRSLRNTTDATPKARVVYFKDARALKAMGSLRLTENPLFKNGTILTTIPTDYGRASKVA